MTPIEALQLAIKVAGSQQALADALQIKSPSISDWHKRGQVPADKCAAIEQATQVRCEELRPDLRWARDAGGQVTGHFVPVVVPSVSGQAA